MGALESGFSQEARKGSLRQQLGKGWEEWQEGPVALGRMLGKGNERCKHLRQTVKKEAGGLERSQQGEAARTGKSPGWEGVGFRHFHPKMLVKQEWGSLTDTGMGSPGDTRAGAVREWHRFTECLNMWRRRERVRASGKLPEKRSCLGWSPKTLREMKEQKREESPAGRDWLLPGHRAGAVRGAGAGGDADPRAGCCCGTGQAGSVELVLQVEGSHGACDRKETGSGAPLRRIPGSR